MIFFIKIYAGRAFLFKRVVNLTFTPIQDRVMLTGRHMVRDVYCKNCKTKLGWMYEYATEDTQKYVEYALLPDLPNNKNVSNYLTLIADTRKAE